MADNRAYVYRRLRSELGLTPAQAAGAVGGLGGESGRTLDPNAVNPSSGALGIGQWLGGRARGVRKGDLRSQTNHLIAELKGPERAALSRLRSAHDITSATRAWVEGFERPSAGEIRSSMPARLGYARDAFNAFGSSGGGGGGSPGATPGGGGSSGASSGSTRTTVSTTPGVDNRVARAALIQSFLGTQGSDPLDFAVQANALKDIAPVTTRKTVRVPGTTVQDAMVPKGSLKSVHSPVGRDARVIGVPHQGTHTLGDWQSDNAVDISVPVGTPMVALQDGVVVKVRHHPQNGGRFAGDQITVRGANGNEYFYAHGVASVKAGQKIRRGQKLGTTGSANGVAHLHFGQERGDPRQHT